MTNLRVCADTVGRGCHKAKPETKFTTRGLNRDGTIRRALLCKPCQAAAQAEWAAHNPEKAQRPVADRRGAPQRRPDRGRPPTAT